MATEFREMITFGVVTERGCKVAFWNTGDRPLHLDRKN